MIPAVVPAEQVQAEEVEKEAAPVVPVEQEVQAEEEVEQEKVEMAEEEDVVLAFLSFLPHTRFPPPFFTVLFYLSRFCFHFM